MLSSYQGVLVLQNFWNLRKNNSIFRKMYMEEFDSQFIYRFYYNSNLFSSTNAPITNHIFLLTTFSNLKLIRHNKCDLLSLEKWNRNSLISSKKNDLPYFRKTTYISNRRHTISNRGILFVATVCLLIPFFCFREFLR